MNRSHLIPEPRANKNGVVAIKWVNSDPDKSASAKALPAPVSSKPEEVAPANDNFVLSGLVYDTHDGDISERISHSVFDMIREDDETVLPYLHELLTTGSDMGREFAKGAIRDDISGIVGALSERGNVDGWRDMCSWGDDIKSSAMQGWSVGNVLAETNVSPDPRALRTVRNNVSRLNGSRMRSEVNVFPYSPVDTQYWRGLTALELSGKLNPMMATVDADEMVFIAWAGHHKDIGLVVRTARERGTIDVDTLRLVTDSTDVEPALREGVL